MYVVDALYHEYIEAFPILNKVPQFCPPPASFLPNKGIRVGASEEGASDGARHHPNRGDGVVGGEGGIARARVRLSGQLQQPGLLPRRRLRLLPWLDGRRLQHGDAVPSPV